jgi:hypothetical protein
VQKAKGLPLAQGLRLRPVLNQQSVDTIWPQRLTRYELPL